MDGGAFVTAHDRDRQITEVLLGVQIGLHGGTELTVDRAKPAVPFGGKFRIIDFTLSNCVNSGIRRIGIATQYHSHGLIHHVQRGWGFLDGRFNEEIPMRELAGAERAYKRFGLVPSSAL